MVVARLALLFVVWGCALLAQNAQLSGLIRDPSGLSVLGADVALRNERTGGRRNTRTNDSGVYSLPSLSPGIYRLSIRKSGFETIVREGIDLAVGENARLDFSLRIGDSGTAITVAGGPLLINSDNAAVGTLVGRSLIDELPLNGRGIQTLIELTPGVTVVPVTDTSRGQFAVNGQRSNANYYTVDGVSANFASGIYAPGAVVIRAIGQAGGGSLPANNFLGTFSNLVSPDALEEFRLQTSTFAPEFGRMPGAQIGLATRSGTNRYSGALFEYLRNDATDANDWFSNQLALRKPPLRFNNFGVTLGGPVRIPGLYNGTDRTFFFFSFEDLLMRQPQPAVSTLVPSAAIRSQSTGPIASLLNAFPVANRPASDTSAAFPGWENFSGSSSLANSQRTWGVRFDHYFSEKLIFFARYNHAPSERREVSPTVAVLPNPADIQLYAVGTDTLTFGTTWTAAPNVVNELRLNGSRADLNVTAGISSLGGAKSPLNSFLFPQGYSASTSNVTFQISPVDPVTVGELDREQGRQFQFVDDLSRSRGKHLFKFGFDYRWFSPRHVTPLLSSTFVFSGLTGSGGVIGGIAASDVVNRTAGGLVYAVPAFSAYSQDTWRASRNLTVTYGLRWEMDPPPKVTQGQILTVQGLDNLTDLSHVALAPAGTPLYPARHTDFTPRAGATLQLFDGKHGRTVLRAGAGLYYDTGQNGFEDYAYQSTATSVYKNVSFGSIPNGQPGSTSTSATNDANAVLAAHGYRLPRIYEWNVTLEHAIGRQTFSAAYVGSAGRGLIGSTALGLVKTTAGGTILDLQVFGNNGHSDYHSLQLQYNRRLASRLEILLSYTWAHSMDDLSNDLGSPVVTPNVNEYLNPRIDRGPSDFDVRHSLNGSVVMGLPAPRARWLTKWLGKWTASSIFFARSALPTDLYTISASYYLIRPDVVPAQPLYLNGPQYPGGKRYNPAAFATARPGQPQGDLGRNVLRGFGAWQSDLAIHREIALRGGVSLQLGAEAFNVFNHPNFANPAFETTDPGHELAAFRYPQFGLSSETLATALGASGIPGQLNPLFQIGGPRSLQFALRVGF